MERGLRAIIAPEWPRDHGIVPGPRAASNKKSRAARGRRWRRIGEPTHASSDAVALYRWNAPPLSLVGRLPCHHLSAAAHAMLAANLLAGDNVDTADGRLDFQRRRNCKARRGRLAADHRLDGL